MKVLNLTLIRSWFDLILYGIKKEEYREIKPYWIKRLVSGKYDAIRFVNGYGSDRPAMLIELRNIRKGIGRREWGAPSDPVFILSLGKVLGVYNIDPVWPCVQPCIDKIERSLESVTSKLV